MISGANEEELEIANDRADLLLKIQELENINDKLSSALNSSESKLDQLTNNWNELEEYILNHYIVGHTIQNASLDDILRKMKEIKGDNK